MKIISKYFLGILVFSLCLVSTLVFAGEKVPTKKINSKSFTESVNTKGTITAIDSNSFTISTKKGPKTIISIVNFDSKTKFKIEKEKKSSNDKINKNTKSKKIKVPESTINNFKVGDMVMVKGILNNGEITNVISVRQELGRKSNFKKLKSN